MYYQDVSCNYKIDTVKKTLLILILSVQIIYGQENFIKSGNEFLYNNKNSEAEQVFRDAIKSDSTNLIYKSQLGLALINQGKNIEAKSILDDVLKIDSLNVAALWYSGINSFQDNKGNFRNAIKYFEKSYPLIDEKSSQYFAVNYFIGKSYRNLLYTEGITQEETDRMLETYKVYTKLQPNAEDYQETINFIKYIEEKRPSKNVIKWILKNSNSSEEIGTFTIVEINSNSVKIPGKWTQLNTMDDSGQVYFTNSEKVIIAIAHNPKKAYPFFKNEKNNYKNVENFYKWDSDYRKELKFKTNKIKENTELEYIIWKYNDNKLDNVFLFGSIKDNFINLLIYTDDWNEEKKVEFLEKTYKLNK